MVSLNDDTPSLTHVRCLVVPRFNMLTLTALIEPLRIANYLSASPLFERHLHSLDGERVVASNGMDVTCTEPPERCDRGDLIVVFGSWGAEFYKRPKLLSWLRLQSRLGVQICGVEIGSYLLARAGLLDGRKATTHWSFLSGFREQFPKVEAVEQLFTIESNMMTCAGGTAGADLMLHLIEAAHGARLTAEICDHLMQHNIRQANDTQRATPGHELDSPLSAVTKAVNLVEAHASDPLTVPEIAKRVGLSQRQLERQFRKTVGCSVVQFSLLSRLQRARSLLISTDLSVREISAESGFNSLSHFAYAFRKCFDKRPSDYRQAWPEQDIEPHWPGSLARYLESLDMRHRADEATNRKAR